MPACPACGHVNPEGFRFCGACGASIAPMVPREVRKTVTVLFADVTGSTALGDRLDPETFRRVISRYFEEMRTVLDRHGGTVEKFIGDAVMAVFGVPLLHEDDALRAVRAAAEMRARLAALNERLEQEFGVRLEARIGVNTGEVVTTEAASGERLASGDAVNVAARLEQAAGPGEILLGRETMRLTRHAITVEPVEALALQGKAALVDAYRLERVAHDAEALERRFEAPLVGRGQELAMLASALDEAVGERRCRLLTVLAAPGIGKSRLARAFAAAHEDVAAFSFGRCLPYGEGITYWPLHEIFATRSIEHELRSALGEEAPEEIALAVRKSLEKIARARPTVLVIEDIHWAEPALLDLIEHIVDWTRDAPLMLVCLARPELLDARPAWASGRPAGRIIRLPPLSEGESGELIEALLRGSRLDERTRARIQILAAGNPLFVEQSLALLAEEGRPDDVPPTIQALLAARLDALPDEERAVVERASVIGLEFEWGALAALSPDGRRPAGSHLAALVRKEFIQPHELAEDTFRFRHILIRDVAYERIPKDVRSSLHERVAARLDDVEDFEEIVGYHLEQAYRFLAELGPPGVRAQRLADRAAERLSSSGRRAYARGDMRAAANLLDRAAALLPPDDPRRLGLLPTLGRSLVEAGEWERAAIVLSDAVERAPSAGERGVAADASVALASLRLHTGALTRHDQVRLELDEAIQAFEELHDRAGLARALTFAGSQRFWRGEAAGSVDGLERAARHAHAVGDRAAEGASLRMVMAAHLHGPTPVDAALRRIEAIHRRMPGSRRLGVDILADQAWLEAMRGRFQVARKKIAQAQALAEELGLRPTMAVVVLNHAGRIELLAGDPATAEGVLRRACETLREMGDLGHLSSVAPVLADALFALEKGGEAEPWIELLTGQLVAEDIDGQAGWRRSRAKLMAARGALHEAERLAREAVAIAAPTDFLELRASCMANLAEVLHLAGRQSEAADALEEAIRLHEQKGNLAAAESLRARVNQLPIGP